MAAHENKFVNIPAEAQEEPGRTDDEFGDVPPGARTSEYYRTHSLPERFDNPDCFAPYNSEGYKLNQHPMYMTTNSIYGQKKPTVHTMPTCFYAKSQEFTGHLGQCGMYRNHSLNTAPDKSKV